MGTHKEHGGRDFGNEGYALMGAALEVFNGMGSGFLEDVYPESPEAELTGRSIEFRSKPNLIISNKQRPLRQHYEPGLLVFGAIIAELKVTVAALVSCLTPAATPSSGGSA